MTASVTPFLALDGETEVGHTRRKMSEHDVRVKVTTELLPF